MKITVMLVDDHTIVREGLLSLLERSEDIEVVAQAENGLDAVERYETLQPDVVVMDLTMPVMGGIEATGRIIARHPDARILALSMILDRGCATECFKAGAKGYLLKDCAGKELVDAIRFLHNGKSYLSSAVTNIIMNELGQNKYDPAKPHLSNRELEVLRLIADGKNTKEIAFQLNVSNKTIETIRMNTMKKIGMFSIAELTKYAIREGISTV